MVVRGAGLEWGGGWDGGVEGVDEERVLKEC